VLPDRIELSASPLPRLDCAVCFPYYINHL
jgi:hypothetical protein